MRISEILLRLGSNLVGWLIIYSHCIWLGVIPQVGCGADGDELYLLSLGFSPLAIMAAMVLGFANRLTEVVDYLRWLALPMVLLLPLAVLPVLEAIETTTVGGDGLCATIAATMWQRAWAPIQLITLIIIVVFAGRFALKYDVRPEAGQKSSQ